MAERIERIGQRFGDYWLRRRLGGGSFGDVYLGEQVHEHSLAAVKVLHIRLTRSEELRAFINEVRTFRLQHPHIVRVLDVGIAQDETPFLVMEYAPGGTLRDRHPKGSRLSQAQVLLYVLPVASALQYAHDRHLIHRDVKPENMLLGARAELWLSDFGIATVAHSTHSLTTEAMGGTVPYMAPEQIQGRPRPQSDQYALAIVVYEWLTGTWPFRGTSLEIAMQHQMTPPPALRTQVPTLAPEVEQVVLTALAKEPKQRFASVLDFARALEQASQVEQSTLVEPQSVQPPAPALQMPVPLPSVPLMHNIKGGLLQEEQRRQAEEERVQNIEEQPSPLLTQTFPPTTSPHEAIPKLRPVSLSSDGLPQAAIPSQSPAALLPPPTLGRIKRRLSPAAVVVLILLTLILLGGASFGIYGAATGKWPWNVWHAQTSGTSQDLLGVAWSGSQFVAVGYSSPILTSPDGRTWTAQNSGTSQYLNSVAWSGSQFVAVGESSTILTSPDGRTWTAQNSGTSQNLNDVVWSGSQFVAVGESSTILTSPDGRTWTAQHSGTSEGLWGVAWSGSQFVAVGDSGTSSTILTSPDGRTWTAQHSGTSQNLYGVAWSGSQFVAVGSNGTILTSLDGRAWTAQNSGTSQSLQGVVWSGSQFVAVGSNGTILTSP